MKFILYDPMGKQIANYQSGTTIRPHQGDVVEADDKRYTVTDMVFVLDGGLITPVVRAVEETPMGQAKG